MGTLKGMWAALDNTGRIVLIACVTVVIVVALITGHVVDMSWLLGG